MNKLIQDLAAEGCDMDKTMNRFLDDEAFYAECLGDMLMDPAFKELKKVLQAQDTKSAFEYAHSLKGIIGNMGLTSMFNAIVRLVEVLRAGSLEGTDEMYLQLMEEHQKYLTIYENNNVE